MAGAPRAVARRAWAPLALALALGVTAAGAVPGAAAARLPGSDVGVSWAYGGVVNAARTLTVGAVEVGYSDHSNYAVVLNETASANGTIQLSITRVLGTSGFIAACYPNCSAPIESLWAQSSGYEYEAAELTLVDDARVLVNGTSEPALGLAHETLAMSGNLTVAFLWQNLSVPGAPRSEWFNATTLANTSGNFSAVTPLGLVPAQLADGLAWSSTGSYDANASTSFGGRLAYAGDLLPPSNATEFGGSTVPISPMATALNGSDTGSPADAALAGDAALALTPADDGTNLLEGALLVPTSAYFFAAFASACSLAQRPCIADAATPQLDYDANATAHLGWDAAVSSISAFACWFNASAVEDTPDGSAFWSPATDVAPALGPTGDGSAGIAGIIAGVPMPVAQAEAIQEAWHPGSLGPGRSGGGGTAPTPRPPGHPGRGSGSAAGPNGTLLPSLPGGSGLPEGPITAAAVAAIGGAIVLGLLVAARRRRPPRRPVESEVAIVPVESEGAADAEGEPMGYVW